MNYVKKYILVSFFCRSQSEELSPTNMELVGKKYERVATKLNINVSFQIFESAYMQRSS